jgi:uncharacterized protein (DUF2336 family)
MSAVPASLLPELEDALRHIASDRHAETVGRVADLFLTNASRFSEEHVHVFDRVLGRLIVTIETKALAQLARRLAPVRNAPREVIGRLARNTDIAVAAPVLTRSTRLEDRDLIDIAMTTSQAHRLAISGRVSLSEAVTDVLADCGDRDVTRNVAMNRGARFSETGLNRLAERAVHDSILAEKLAQRSDVPPHVLGNLVLTANDAVQQRLLAVVSADTRADIQHLLAGVPPDVADAAADAEAQRVVRALQRAGKLDEAKLLDFANTGRMKETIAAIALLCDVPVEVARRLLADEQADAALILCQAAGMSWPAACTMLKACNRGRANQFDHRFAHFDRLTTATAESIVGFWRACGTTQAA